MTRRTALSRLTTCRLMPLSSATASSDRPTEPRSSPPANNTQRTPPRHHTRAKRTGRTVSPPVPRVCASPAQLTRLRGQRQSRNSDRAPLPPPQPTDILLLRNRCSCKTANALTNSRADWNMIDKVSTMAAAGGQTAAAASRRRRSGRRDAGRNRQPGLSKPERRTNRRRGGEGKQRTPVRGRRRPHPRTWCVRRWRATRGGSQQSAAPWCQPPANDLHTSN